jgi:hypothetical protein
VEEAENSTTGPWNPLSGEGLVQRKENSVVNPRTLSRADVVGERLGTFTHAQLILACSCCGTFHGELRGGGLCPKLSMPGQRIPGSYPLCNLGNSVRPSLIGV